MTAVTHHARDPAAACRSGPGLLGVTRRHGDSDLDRDRYWRLARLLYHIVLGLAGKHDISCGVDLFLSFLGSNKLTQEICVSILIFSSCYYWDFFNYWDYSAGKCSA